VTRRFRLDEPAARAALDAMTEADKMPYLSESPARLIEGLVFDLDAHIEPPDGFDTYSILLYPLIYEGDPDGILIVVRPPRPGPALASYSMAWDDLLTRDAWGRELTTDEVIETLGRVVWIANDLLDSAR